MDVVDAVKFWQHRISRDSSDSDILRIEALERDGMICERDLDNIAQGRFADLETFIAEREEALEDLRILQAEQNRKEPVPMKVLAFLDPLERDQVGRLLEEGRVGRDRVVALVAEKRVADLQHQIERRWMTRVHECNRATRAGRAR